MCRNAGFDTRTFWLAVALSLSAATSQAAELIAVRATAVLPTEVQTVLSEVAAPVKYRFRREQSLETVLRQHCGGSFSNLIVEQTGKLNKIPSPLATKPVANTEIWLPPCPRIRKNVTIRVGNGDDLESLLARHMGVTPSTMLLDCQTSSADEGAPSECERRAVYDAVARRNKGKALDRLQPGAELSFPFASTWTVFTLRPNVSADGANGAISRLKRAAAQSQEGEALLRSDKADPLHLLTPDSGEELGKGCTAQASPAASQWPLDTPGVATAIADALAFTAGKWTRRTIVRVADTGIDGIGEGRFPLDFVALNNDEPGPNAADGNRPPNQYIGDVYGIDPDMGGDVAPLRSQTNYLHGSQVASLALGGPQIWRNVPGLDRLIGINFARLFRENFGGSIWANPATLGDSVKTGPVTPDIINMSVGSTAPIAGFQSVLDGLTTTKQLLVIAAGNDGFSLSETAIYPASYARDHRQSILVVGGHDIGNMRTENSNHGREYVDILAPGCLIADPLGGDEPLHGTSAAAPLVTFTAALLFSFMEYPSPAEIRARLQASAKFVSDTVEREVAFGGILDAVTALRLFDDVVRLRNGKRVIGFWKHDGLLRPCGENPYNLLVEHLLRVRVVMPGDGQKIRLKVLRRDAQYKVSDHEDEIDCEPAAANITVVTDTGEETLNWQEIESLVPAHRDRKRRVPAGSAPIPVAAATLPSTGESQQILKELGFYDGRIDGKEGPETREAIRRFQKTISEQPTGTFTDLQVQTLQRASRRAVRPGA